jgi:FkbM family methyltransferase
MKLRVQVWLRLLAIRAGAFYRATRRLEALVRYVARRPHEPDFAGFGRFGGEDGLFLDVGANTGLAAVSFRLFKPRTRILSIEPNPAHERELRFVKRFLRGFDYMICGASDRNGSATLYIPTYRSNPITPLATFHREYVEAEWRQQILFGKSLAASDFGLSEQHVQIRRLDDLGLEPAYVKIDVEGHELPVLRGLEETIRRHRPVILIEWSREFGAIEQHLAERDYKALVYDPTTREFQAYDRERHGLNIFCVPRAVAEESSN